MRYAVVLLGLSIAACAPTGQGVGFGDRVGGGTAPGGFSEEDAEFVVPVVDGQPQGGGFSDGRGSLDE